MHRILKRMGSSILEQRLFRLFDVRPVLSGGVVLLDDKRLHEFRLAGTLLAIPQVLVVSGPFVKLSTPAHRLLFGLLRQLAQLNRLRVILILSVLSSVPSFVARIIPMRSVGINRGVRHRRCIRTFYTNGRVHVRRRTKTLRRLRQYVLSLPCRRTGFASSRIIGLGKIDVHCSSHAVLGRLS